MGEKYVRLGDKALKGEYELIEPLDYMLLDKLQPEGTTFADLYPIGTTVRELEKLFPQLRGSQIAARIRSLHVQHLAKKVRMIGADLGGRGKPSVGSSWQRTKTADELLQEWKVNNGNQGS